MIIHNLLQSVRLLADGLHAASTTHCARGIEPTSANASPNCCQRSLMLVTALNPHIGYDKAAEIAKRAHAQGSTLREAAHRARAT